MTKIAMPPITPAAPNSATQSPVLPNPSGGVSVLGPDIVVTGNIEASVDLHIEGRVVGDVRCATLVLGTTSVVTGSVSAERVRVLGRVEGAIDTSDLAVEATASVTGDVTYSRIRVANGGVIAGSLTYRPAAGDGAVPVKLTLVEEENAPERVRYFE